MHLCLARHGKGKKAKVLDEAQDQIPAERHMTIARGQQLIWVSAKSKRFKQYQC